MELFTDVFSRGSQLEFPVEESMNVICQLLSFTQIFVSTYSLFNNFHFIFFIFIGKCSLINLTLVRVVWNLRKDFIILKKCFTINFEVDKPRNTIFVWRSSLQAAIFNLFSVPTSRYFNFVRSSELEQSFGGFCDNKRWDLESEEQVEFGHNTDPFWSVIEYNLQIWEKQWFIDLESW